jgi:hypothetical protein
MSDGRDRLRIDAPEMRSRSLADESIRFYDAGHSFKQDVAACKKSAKDIFDNIALSLDYICIVSYSCCLF